MLEEKERQHQAQVANARRQRQHEEEQQVNQECRIINVEAPQDDGARRNNIDNRRHNPFNHRAHQVPDGNQSESSYYNDEDAPNEETVIVMPTLVAITAHQVKLV